MGDVIVLHVLILQVMLSTVYKILHSTLSTVLISVK